MLFFAPHDPGLSGNGESAPDVCEPAEEGRPQHREPAELSAALKLFDGLLNASDTEGAASALAQLRPQLDEWTRLECDAKLATRLRQPHPAKAALHALCLGPAQATRALVGAANSFYEAGWGADVEKVFRLACDEPGCNPEVGTLFAERIVQHKAWARRKEVYALLEKGELGRHAFVVYTNALGERKKVDLLKRLLDRYGKWLRADIRTWAAVGYALTACGEYRRTAQWMKDWRSQKEIAPWHLYNLVLSLRHCGHDREARAISLHAIAMPQQDDSRSDHQLWLALDDALEGNIVSSEARLAEFDGHGLKDCARLLRMMVRSITDVRESPPADRRAEFRSAKRRMLRDFREKIGRGPAELRRAYRRTVRRMAKDALAWPGLSAFVGPLMWPAFMKRIGF